MHAFADAPALD